MSLPATELEQLVPQAISLAGALRQIVRHMLQSKDLQEMEAETLVLIMHTAIRHKR
jgi:hypothetical protein